MYLRTLELHRELYKLQILQKRNKAIIQIRDEMKPISRCVKENTYNSNYYSYASNHIAALKAVKAASVGREPNVHNYCSQWPIFIVHITVVLN